MKSIASRPQNSYMTVLLSNYILFTIGIAIAMILALVFAIWSSFIALKMESTEDVMKYMGLLSSGAYSNVPAQNLLGTGGYFEIVDMENKLLYSNGVQGRPISFTLDEIQLIPEYGKVSSTVESIMKEENKQALTLLRVIRKNSNGEDIAMMIIVDKDYKVVYSVNAGDRKQYSKRAFELLAGEASPKYNVEKVMFRNNQNKQLIMLLYKSRGEMASLDDVMSKLSRSFGDAIKLFLLLYITIIAFSIVWLKKTVDKPLSLLYSAMAEVSLGKNYNPIIYKGPHEFEEICISFNRMIQRLNMSEAEKRKMLADISHDLKTPITVIKGYLKALRDGIISEIDLPQYISVVYEKAENMNVLVDAFYEYSKLTHPGYNLILKQEDICEFMRQCLALQVNLMDAEGFGLEANVPEEEIAVRLDKVQLMRVFDNLIANMRKHNPKGTCLYLTIQRMDAIVRIIVADNGMGIPEAITEKLFEAFVVGDESRNSKQGSGLGLAICKQIIVAHHGEIHLMKDPPEPYKTAFVIALPIEKSC